jgi:hypothetical protein
MRVSAMDDTGLELARSLDVGQAGPCTLTLGVLRCAQVVSTNVSTGLPARSRAAMLAGH